VKYILDTNVYFAALRKEQATTALRELLSGLMPNVWLSSVVLYELLSGARGDLGRAAIGSFTRPLVRVGRVVAPSDSDWLDAGTAQSRIWDLVPSLRTKRLQNDLLIACSSRKIGAAVVTENAADFRVIGRYVPHVALSIAEITRKLRSGTPDT
jgi:predicted nucleic acid-binding protein